MAEGTRTVQLFGHPGAGRRRARPRTKGRHPDRAALATVRALLGKRPRRRDLLIEHLHLIQDSRGCLPAGLLTALAQEMNMALSEVYEVATFYHHFDVLADDQPRPPPVTIRVCDSIACEMAGADALIGALEDRAGADVRVLRAPCMGACDRAPAVSVGHNPIAPADADAVLAAAAARLLRPSIPAYTGLRAYREQGGYERLQACRAGALPVEDVIQTLEDSGLRGLGGAGFPAGRKWRFVRAEPGPRHLAVNADEGEPGTFKDRYFIETDPHRFLEGMLIGQWAVEAEISHIYLRDEYPACREILLREIAALEAAGLAPAGSIVLRRGAGAYICGEESAMLESLEGKRGLPRHKPPFPAQVGLFGRPTLINNVETLYWVRDILANGPEWYADRGRNGRKGLRSYSVSGRVKRPGVKIVDAGITVAELIEEHCGGMQDGHVFKGYLPGGASGGILPAGMADIPLDFGTLEEHGCLIGSAAVVILSQRDSAASAALNLMRFFEDESCGQCTPCRAGCQKAVGLMRAPEWNRTLLKTLSRTMVDASICGLGQAAPNGLVSVLRHFPDDVPNG